MANFKKLAICKNSWAFFFFFFLTANSQTAIFEEIMINVRYVT